MTCQNDLLKYHSMKANSRDFTRTGKSQVIDAKVPALLWRIANEDPSPRSSIKQASTSQQAEKTRTQAMLLSWVTTTRILVLWRPMNKGPRSTLQVVSQVLARIAITSISSTMPGFRTRLPTQALTSHSMNHRLRNSQGQRRKFNTSERTYREMWTHHPTIVSHIYSQTTHPSLEKQSPRWDSHLKQQKVHER